ncbi:MAG: hypothetical protein FMNOHCHN_02059 [Ignavibacteriaceae bacterium]|nr:hypothetical protein [Ignavibacteriaceae bacterium]
MKDQEFFDILEAAGHSLARDEDGEIDIWQHDFDVHNGPGCSKCGDTWCMHCKMRELARNKNWKPLKCEP